MFKYQRQVIQENKGRNITFSTARQYGKSLFYKEYEKFVQKMYKDRIQATQNELKTMMYEGVEVVKHEEKITNWREELECC